jgi:hypothetical protein
VCKTAELEIALTNDKVYKYTSLGGLLGEFVLNSRIRVVESP